MCPIYFDDEGSATRLTVEPTDNAGFCMDEPDVLRDFDFDAFLHNSDDAQSFGAFGAFDFSSDANELDSGCVTHEHDKLSSAPVTPLQSIVCFPSSQVQLVPIELKKLKLSYTTLGQNYLEQIVSVHSVCKKTVGLAYPDVLQSQLLTASRTLNKLGDLIIEHHEVVLETGLVTSLKALVLACRCGLSRIIEEEGLSDGDQILSMRQRSVKSSELITYGCLVPLLGVLRAFSWWVSHTYSTMIHGLM